MPWKRMLAYITGSVSEDLLRRIEYLLEENRVLRNQIAELLPSTGCLTKFKAWLCGFASCIVVTAVRVSSPRP
jgi:hypothetical protein